MSNFLDIYECNVEELDRRLFLNENFDIIKKKLCVGSDELTFYYIDGFVKDGIVSKIMIYLLSLDSLVDKKKMIAGESAAQSFVRSHLPYVETQVTSNVEDAIKMIMSGAAVALGSTLGGEAVIIDARTYPARETGEPDGDKVMRGARDGFVETLIFNTALIRRRIRNPSLTMSYISIGESSKTDVVVCYMKDRAWNT